jgi:hypothetical protein
MECVSHPYLQLRTKLNEEGRSSTLSSGQFSKDAQMAANLWLISDYAEQLRLWCQFVANPNPPCQHFLWEETCQWVSGEEKPRLLAELNNRVTEHALQKIKKVLYLYYKL